MKKVTLLCLSTDCSARKPKNWAVLIRGDCVKRYVSLGCYESRLSLTAYMYAYRKLNDFVCGSAATQFACWRVFEGDKVWLFRILAVLIGSYIHNVRKRSFAYLEYNALMLISDTIVEEWFELNAQTRRQHILTVCDRR